MSKEETKQAIKKFYAEAAVAGGLGGMLGLLAGGFLVAITSIVAYLAFGNDILPSTFVPQTWWFLGGTMVAGAILTVCYYVFDNEKSG